MPRRLDVLKAPVRLTHDGGELAARAGEPLVLSLVAEKGFVLSRSPKLHRPRGPYCLRGACEGCLVRVNGVPNLMACQTPAAEGQRVETQNVVGSRELDVLGATDYLFPRGMDHHRLFAGVRGVSSLVQAFARRVSGLGRLADHPELCALMVEAGFKKVFVGIETPSVEGLEECGKVQNRKRDLGESVRMLQRAGLEVMGGFIVGFDSDPTDIFARQFEFIQRTGVVTAMVGVLTALPQTALYRRLAGEGRILAETHGDNTDVAVNFVTRLDPEHIVKTAQTLRLRVDERFPESGLARVAEELGQVTREASALSEWLSRPNKKLRAIVGVAIAALEDRQVLLVVSLLLVLGQVLNIALFGRTRSLLLSTVVTVTLGLLLVFTGIPALGGLALSAGSAVWGILAPLGAILFLGTRAGWPT